MIALVITDGYGNGTLTGSPSDVILHGFSIGEAAAIWTDITDTTTTWTDISDQSSVWKATYDRAIVGKAVVGKAVVGKNRTTWT